MTFLRTFLIGTFLTGFLAGQAQIRIIPIVPQEDKKIDNSSIQRSTNQLTLPFWEDFSYAGQPDVSSWQNSENVFVNAGFSFDPPSLYVASFDGLDANGNPYSPGSAEGPADSLVSQIFDFSVYDASDNIYMSFFYQFAGLGDQPEPKDSLQLEFRNSAGEWESVWPSSANNLDRSGSFKQVLFRISDPQWFHSAFQFRYTSYGRLSGAFDLWNVDYIYLNTNRDPFDSSYPDRAISEPLTGFLGDYRQVPYQHFNQSQLTMPSFRLRNMVISASNQNKAYNYFFNYSIDVTDTLGNTSNFSNSTFVEPLESPIASNSSEEVVIREPFADFGGNPAADSAHVLLEIILDAEDNVPISEGGDYDPVKYSPVDFQENDTLRDVFILSDVYAYDDGKAELGAGLNTAGDRLAYQYTLQGVPDALITGMDIYFPFTGTSPEGKQLELTVWQDEGGEPGPVIFRQQVNARLSDKRNEMVRYEFARPVLISGTFYIGYRQNSPGALAIGLDANTPTGDKLFFNLGELWEANNLVDGSLMLRPVFARVTDTIVGIEDETETTVAPYPNPSGDGIFYVHHTGSIAITDLSGRSVDFEATVDGNRTRIELRNPASGLYVVRSGGQVWRIIIP